jgi:hypothetical protein
MLKQEKRKLHSLGYKSLKLAKEAKNADFVKMNTDSLKEW